MPTHKKLIKFLQNYSKEYASGIINEFLVHFEKCDFSKIESEEGFTKHRQLFDSYASDKIWGYGISYQKN